MFKKFAYETYSARTYVFIIAGCVVVLSVIGLLMVYSVTSATNVENGISPFKDAAMQFVYCLAGVAIAFCLAKMKVVVVSNPYLVYGFWAFSFLLVLAVPFLGYTVNGAQRWLSLGFVTIQPSEFLKIALVLVLVKVLDDYNAGVKETWIVVALVVCLVIFPLAFLYVTQRDLGTTLVCACALLAIAYFSGVNIAVVGTIAIVGVIGAIYSVFFAGDFRSGRLNFIDPWNDGQGGYGAGYNVIRSYYAISSGGIFGMGLGNSHEKFDFLYAADNDFIFAVICEELGLLGGLLVLACVLGIFFSCVKLTGVADDFSSKLIIWAAAIILITQSFLNIGCAVGALPTTGKPLPFVSSGGSAVVASFMLVGLIFNSALNSESKRRESKRREAIQIVSKKSRTGSDSYRSEPVFFEGKSKSGTNFIDGRSKSGTNVRRTSEVRSRRNNSSKTSSKTPSRANRRPTSTRLKDPSFLDRKR